MKRLLFFINPNAGHAEIRSSLMEVLAIFCKACADQIGRASCRERV